MFKNLKQKIAEGVEGVSPGRQTPLQSKSNNEEGGSLSTSSPTTTPRKALLKVICLCIIYIVF